MKLYVTFKQLNPDFDKKFADKFYFGQESDNNRRDNWSKGYFVSDNIKDTLIIENEPFKISIQKKNNEVLEVFISNMKILRCITYDDKQIDIAISKNLIKKINKPYNKKYDILRIYFCLNMNEFLSPNDFVYIYKNDYPKE